MTAQIHQFPYAPPFEARWDAHRGEYARNHFGFLGSAAKALIFGGPFICIAPFVLAGTFLAAVLRLFERRA